MEKDENKKNKADFVLWFTKSKFDDQELKWNSPWGLGYPGWHIECSCISMKHLGEYLDIHCGGVDNIFPHHTNEIAQSEAYLGHEWCKYWFHVLHLNTNSGKMSKSSGEFLTVSLLEEKGYDPMAYRFFCLQSHYRKSLIFTWENLDNAATAYDKLLQGIAKLQPGTAVDEECVFLQKSFREAMDNDLNTALGITALYDVLKAKISDGSKLALIASFDTVLSLNLLEGAAKIREADALKNADPAWIAHIEEQIALRTAAKKEKNFVRADAIRAALPEQGIVLEDTAAGTVYKLQ